MARININNIEKVEGKYHLMFVEGKNMVEATKSDLRYVWFSLLFFASLILLFIVISGLNLFYIAFLVVFLLFFLISYVFLKLQKRAGIKQCIYAVQNSKSTDIIAKQASNTVAGKLIVRSVSGNIDKYAERESFDSFRQRRDKKKKQKHLTGIITQFEKEEKK